MFFSRRSALALVAFTAMAGLAQAQGGTPIKLLVGFPAGAGTDAIARMLGEKLKDELGAPVVVAKGRGELALKIREIARDNAVPLLEAPPLARALYKHCELEQAIPAALYTAVAEVMAYVYQLDAWMKQGGQQPEAPADLQVPEGMDPGAAEE